MARFLNCQDIEKRIKKLYKHNEPGVALIMILWVLVLLNIIVLQFALSMRTEVEITRNFKDRLDSYYCAIAAMEVARYELKYVISKKPILGGEPTNLDPFPVGVNDVDKIHWSDLRKSNTEEVDEGAIMDKESMKRGSWEYKPSSRLQGHNDLNRLVKDEGKLERLLEECGVETLSEEMSMIKLSIKDWVDENDTYSVPGLGAEDDWYEDNLHPNGMEYECKDAPFYSTDELKLIRGLRPEMGDATEELERKEEILKCLEHRVEAHPIISNTRFNPNAANDASGIFEYGDEKWDEYLENLENDGIKDPGARISYCEVTATGSVKGSPVKSEIRAEFRILSSGKIKIISWIDNFVPGEEIDPNLIEDSG